VVLFQKVEGHIGLKSFILNVYGFQPNGGIRLEYVEQIYNIVDLSNIVKIAWAEDNPQGENEDSDKLSLFYKNGFNVLRVGDFNNVDQLETEDTDPFLIEVDYPKPL
jgi:hypothetical protein